MKVEKNLLKIFTSLFIFIIILIIQLDEKYKLIPFFISYIIVGYDVILKAVRNIIKGQIFDENFLMSIATIGAFLIHEYPEGVAVMLFYKIGEYFQDRAVDKSRKAITKLMDIRPDYANLIINNEIKKVNPEDVKIGDIIFIKPGEKIPLDGVVIEGSSNIDTSALTGESMPKEATVKSEVLSGSININGILKIKVNKEFSESTVSKILDLVENAVNKKAKTENFITKFARYYTPAVVIIAVILAVFPPLFTGADFSKWIYRALLFLVVSCPCALVISVPLGFFGGIGGASKNGILIKGSNYLETLSKVDTIVFDKTGTLTKGEFTVTEIHSEILEKNDFLSLAALCESYSNHPIAISIKKAYNYEIDDTLIDSIEEIPGKGLKAVINNKIIFLGNSSLMNDKNIEYKNIKTVGTTIYLSTENEYLGYLVISDKVKDDAVSVIYDLAEIGIKKTVMLTGDNETVAKAVAKKLCLNEYYAQLLPYDKVEKLESIMEKQNKNKKLAFIGDGINDAPVLARADIGIAMGALGSDAAIEAADVVIMTDELSKITTAIKISKKTMKIVKQNIAFALFVKFFILILGVLGIASMWVAVFADVGVSVIAILNSIRTLNVEKLK